MELSNKSQIKLIHILKSKLTLSDEEYRELIMKSNSRGVRSSKELTRNEAQIMIWGLTMMAKTRGIKWTNWATTRKKYSDYDGRPEMATPLQMRKIEAMWKDVSFMRTDEEREKAFRRFLEKRFHVSDIRFLTQEVVHKIIKTLGAMKNKSREAA